MRWRKRYVGDDVCHVYDDPGEGHIVGAWQLRQQLLELQQFRLRVRYCYTSGTEQLIWLYLYICSGSSSCS